MLESGKGWPKRERAIDRNVLDLTSWEEAVYPILAISLLSRFDLEVSCIDTGPDDSCEICTQCSAPCNLAVVSVVKSSWQGSFHESHF